MESTRLPGGAETSRLGFGCSGLMGAGDPAARQSLLACALDSGIRHFDVAPLYGLGFAEEELGRFAKGRRHDLTLATKAGMLPTPLPAASLARVMRRAGLSGTARQVEQRARVGRSGRFSPADVARSLETSLRKLQTDYVDIFLLHECRATDLANEALLRCLEDARQSGKVRAFGLATAPDDILAARRLAPGYLGVEQFENSVMAPNLERLRQRSPAFTITHRALGESLSKARSWLAGHPDWLAAAAEAGLETAEGLSSAMLAYALSDNPGGIVLFSSRSKDHIRANAASALFAPNVQALKSLFGRTP